MIKINNIDKYFNRHKRNEIHVINHTSLELDDKGLVALLGPSGSGKTTLLNAIGGLDKVGSGNIFINDKKITSFYQNRVDEIRNLNIGYIFQDYKLIEDMSVYDNVSIVLKMIGIKDKKEIDKRVCYVLDKVGMLRYKRRPCSMLSGGERQRVGIARAIVKNPDIVIADEPTGNLDSKNSIEIMNIIKAISKDKLVILVTHEANLAKFYASRIIELEDGKIINDYINQNNEDLDYEISNTLYLKDYKYQNNYDGVEVYSNSDEALKVKIVVSNHNIYIKTNDNRKVEVLDSSSTIDMIDDHRRNISLDDVNKYNFDYEKIINNTKKLKYSSIFNPITFITSGFKKVLDYSILKKFLLIGFFLSGCFIIYATSSIVNSLTLDESKFVKINPNYLIIESKKIALPDYLNWENNLGAEYIMPTNSVVQLGVNTSDFYQTKDLTIGIEGSLANYSLAEGSRILYGRQPTNDREIMVDEVVLRNVIKKNMSKMIGYSKVNDFLNKTITIPVVGDFTIVGIVDSGSPSIYVSKNHFINILYHNKSNNNSNDDYMFDSYSSNSDNILDVDDYNLYSNKVTLKEGRWPTNDYETIVNINNKEEMKINKQINKTIYNTKLKVVGYYTSKDSLETYLVNSNMIKYKTVLSSQDVAVYSKDKNNTLRVARENYHLNIKDSYISSKDKYLDSQKESIKSSLISSGLILGISLIEILLMIRSSFLSRIKEVGIYRAIGIKKKDIYIMFSGEIIAITTLASIPGILFAAYILNSLSKISYINDYFIMNIPIILLSIIFVFIFNLIVGLIPVFNTIRKRPAEILSRTDI